MQWRRRKCLWTCDQGKGQSGLDVPFQLQVTSRSVTPGLARPRENTQGYGPQPCPSLGPQLWDRPRVQAMCWVRVERAPWRHPGAQQGRDSNACDISMEGRSTALRSTLLHLYAITRGASISNPEAWDSSLGWQVHSY